MLGDARGVLDDARKKGCEVILPVDLVTAEKMEPGTRTNKVAADAVPSNEMALDIGPNTVRLFETRIKDAGTIVWNGPMGVFEIGEFKAGTLDVAEAVGSAKGFSVVGGGDTVRAVEELGVADRISYISTGGGAFMEFMEGKTLPGVAALER